jgi:hypothetical protein
MSTPKPIWIDTQPALCGVEPAGRALGLGPLELLHAGPPLLDPRRPPPVLASAIVMTCLHEGWASDVPAAEQLIADGSLTLSPAQDRACVTPLAAVVSAGTPLLLVSDPARPSATVYAPVSALRGVDTRMGHRDPVLLAHLKQRDLVVAPALKTCLERQGPIALWPVAASGLSQGDDLHAITAHANQALASVLRDRGAVSLADDVDATPLFFLTLWMAACALVLRSAEGGALPSMVTRAGGNGERFGIALAGNPTQWVAADATPPLGAFLPHVPADQAVAGAIGDSAVVDMLGLGGQRLALSPDTRALFVAQIDIECSADPNALEAKRLLVQPQALLGDAWPLGLDAEAVVGLPQAPLVLLAMLARDGVLGLCGRGIYRPPISLFNEALQACRAHACGAVSK